jgi:hypothetical protein
VKRSLLRLVIFTFAATLTTTGCKTLRVGTYGGTISDREALRKDNRLAFAPSRIWALAVSYTDDPNDAKASYVQKEFRYQAFTTQEKKALVALRARFPTDESFYQALELQLEPLDDSDERIKTERFEDGGADMIRLTYRSRKPQVREGSLRITRLRFPDPFLKRAFQGCDPGPDAVDSGGQSVGLEVSFVTKDPDAVVEPWEYTEETPQGASLKTWMLTEGKRVTYRAWFRTTDAHSSCPLPPTQLEAIRKLFHRFTWDTGVGW